jgi:EmrB/QacA subfamily drug resistance transporter
MFMEQLDATIVNTAVPAMAQSLHVTPLSLKSVVASYILSLAVFLPASGWAANRFGARSVFACAVSVFTLSSALCSLAMNAPMLVCGRILQGVGAALMVPVGRLAIVRTFPKSELLSRMNFILIPALMGPLLGPTIGGVIVSVTSWRVIFLVNLPVGITALLFIRSCFPDYRATTRSPLDLLGLALFASGTALLSWVLHLASEGGEGRHLGALLTVSGACLAAYGLHSNRRAAPLLDLALFKVRTFRVAVTGGLVTRLGAGGLPFLLPLLYQLGLGFSAWQSGLLMIPSAAAAMIMKTILVRLLARHGFRRVLIVNTLLMGTVIAAFSLVTYRTGVILIVLLALAQGLCHSLQFSSMNALAYADVVAADTAMASTIASTCQQMGMGFGLAVGALVTTWFLGGEQSNQLVLGAALRHAMLTLGLLTALSSVFFWSLHSQDGLSLSRSSRDK